MCDEVWEGEGGGRGDVDDSGGGRGRGTNELFRESHIGGNEFKEKSQQLSRPIE